MQKKQNEKANIKFKIGGEKTKSCWESGSHATIINNAQTHPQFQATTWWMVQRHWSGLVHQRWRMKKLRL